MKKELVDSAIPHKEVEDMSLVCRFIVRSSDREQSL